MPFFINPAKEKLRTYFVKNEFGFFCMNLDENNMCTEVFEIKEKSDSRKFCWHDSISIIDPRSSILHDLGDDFIENKDSLRQERDDLSREKYIATLNLSEGRGIISSCSEENIKNQYKALYNYGITPEKIASGLHAWAGVYAHLNISTPNSVTIIAYKKDVFVVHCSKNTLSAIDHLVWDKDLSDYSSFILTSIIPLLQQYDVMADDSKIHVVDFPEKESQEIISILKNSMGLKKFQTHRESSYGRFLLMSYQKFLQEHMQESSYLEKYSLPLIKSRNLLLYLAGLTILSSLFISFSQYTHNESIKKLGMQKKYALEELKGLTASFIAIKSNKAKKMQPNLDIFFNNLTCSLPDSVWLNSMVLQLDKQKIILQGYSRFQGKLYDWSSSLVKGLALPEQEIRIDYINDKSFTHFVKERQRNSSIKILGIRRPNFSRGNKIDAVSFQVTNYKGDEKVSF